MTMQHDVIVVGAGPGGSTVAKTCAEEGLKVVLIDKRSQPGLKVCAGGLEFQVIDEFKVDEGAVECFPEGLYLCDRKRWIERKMKYANVYRKKFDSYLAERALEAGAKFLASTECVGVIKNGESVKGVIAKSQKGEMEKLSGSVVVAADGFYSTTARSAGLEHRYGRSDFGVTIQCEVYTKARVRDEASFHFYGSDIANCGYGWIYPKKNSYTVGMGCLASEMQGGGLVGKLQYLIFEHPIASKILSKVTSISKFEGACVPLKQSDNVCNSGILVVGDAAGQVAALSGSGIYCAMKAGHLAGQVVVEATSEGDVSKEKLQKYKAMWDSQLGQELKRQKRVLDKLDNHFARYMEFQILLENYPKIKKFANTSAGFIKPLVTPLLLH